MSTAKRQEVSNRFGRAKASNTPTVMDQVSPEAVQAASDTANDPVREAERFAGMDSSTVQGIIKDHAPSSLRRPEYKGKRKQVAFRLTVEPLKAVKMVLELKRGEGAEWFERALHDACMAELERLKPETDEAEWQVAEQRVADAIK